MHKYVYSSNKNFYYDLHVTHGIKMRVKFLLQCGFDQEGLKCSRIGLESYLIFPKSFSTFIVKDMCFDEDESLAWARFKCLEQINMQFEEDESPGLGKMRFHCKFMCRYGPLVHL